MKIAVFYNLNFGGAKRAVFDQVKLLKDKGHLVDVYTTDLETDAFDLSKTASNFHRFYYQQTENKTPFLSRFINDIRTFFILPRLHKKIAKKIDKEDYDIVLVHPDKITQAPFILKFLKTKSVYYCQEPLRIVYEYNLRAKNLGTIKYIYEQITRAIRKKIDLENVRSATFTLSSCYHVRERMIASYGVYPKVSYLGINKKIFVSSNVKKKNQILFLGNKEVVNDGYDLANQAIKELPKKLRPTLKIIAWVKDNNERLTDQELAKEYSSSLAVVCPNRLETFGLVPLESMACGVPVIATNVSGHRETIIDGKTGFLTDFDPIQIKDKILWLIENPALAKKIGEGGRLHIESNWTLNKRIIELEKQLIEFIENK